MTARSNSNIMAYVGVGVDNGRGYSRDSGEGGGEILGGSRVKTPTVILEKVLFSWVP